MFVIIPTNSIIQKYYFTMQKFNPRKEQAIDRGLYILALIMSFLLSIAGNIIYDLYIKSWEYDHKVLVVALAISLAVCLGKLIYDDTNKYLFKSKK